MWFLLRVAICTGRVEAKSAERCTEDGSAVAICTGRVEAKSTIPTRSSPRRCCNLHGACGGKDWVSSFQCVSNVLQSARGVWRQRKVQTRTTMLNDVAICTGRVEAKEYCVLLEVLRPLLQSARGVWRQRYLLTRMVPSRVGCNLHGACGGKGVDCVSGIGSITLQSARGVWRQRTKPSRTKRKPSLQSARGVWRQSALLRRERNAATVAICTGRVEAKFAAIPHHACRRRCNLHGACGGKDCSSDNKGQRSALQSARGVWRQRVNAVVLAHQQPLQSARGVWRQRM